MHSRTWEANRIDPVKPKNKKPKWKTTSVCLGSKRIEAQIQAEIQIASRLQSEGKTVFMSKGKGIIT